MDWYRVQSLYLVGSYYLAFKGWLGTEDSPLSLVSKIQFAYFINLNGIVWVKKQSVKSSIELKQLKREEQWLDDLINYNKYMNNMDKEETYLCLCSMLMMNFVSLARTAADCWAPFLVEQNYRKKEISIW